MKTNTELNYYPSFEALRAVHIDLLRLQDQEGDTTNLIKTAGEFIQRSRVTGAILDDTTQRNSAQSMINFWATALYSAGLEIDKTILIEFDPKQAPSLDGVSCPYRGLSPFDENDDSVFFGRQKLVTSLIEYLGDHRFMVVAGPSGSGKSSVVRAGIIPALKRNALPGSAGWKYLPPMVPGSHPLESLAEIFCPADADIDSWTRNQACILLDDPGTLLAWCDHYPEGDVFFVVDQFEELFTLCENEAEQKAFVANLQNLFEAPGHNHRVILTLRSDFENKVGLLPDFQPIFEANLQRIIPLSAAELRQAIEEPAHMVGLKFEAGVVESLVGDVLGEPAALPLLQFSLLKLWENRERNRVTMAAYQRVGGGREALERAADKLFKNFIEQYQIATRLILLRLVRPGAGLEVTSKRVRRSELYLKSVSEDSINHVLKRLVEERLLRLTPGRKPEDDQVEVAHEALVRNWPTLGDWLDEEREHIRQRQRLNAAAEHWQELDRTPDLLLRGVELVAAKKYEDMKALEAEYVQKSVEAEEAKFKREREEAERLRALNQRLNILYRRILVLAGAVSLVALAAIFFGALATNNYFQAKDAQATSQADSIISKDQKATAQYAQATAESAKATSDAAKAESDHKALALAIAEADAIRSRVEAEDFSHWAQSSRLGLYAFKETRPDLRLLLGIAAMSEDNTFDARNGLFSNLQSDERRLKFLWDMPGSFTHIQLSPQGDWLATTNETGQLAIWDVSSARSPQWLTTLNPSPNSNNNPLTAIAISPDGLWLAATRQENSEAVGFLWDVSGDLAQPRLIVKQSLPLTSTLPISPTNSSQEDGSPGNTSTLIRSLAFSPDSQLLAVADELGRVGLFSLTENQMDLTAAWQAHQGQVTGLFFLPVTSTYVISTTSHISPTLVTAGCIGVNNMIESNVSPCSQGDVMTWDISNPNSPIVLGDLVKEGGNLNSYSDDFVTVGSWVPESRILAVGMKSGMIFMVDLDDPTHPKNAQSYDPNYYYEYYYSSVDYGVTSLVFDVEGQYLATAYENGIIHVLDRGQLQNGPIYSFDADPNQKVFASLSADGSILFAGSTHAGLQVWDVAKRDSWSRYVRQRYEFGYGYGVAFHPIKPWLAVYNYDGGIRLWDYTNPLEPRLLANFGRGSRNYYGRLAFSPDGKNLLVIGDTVELWRIDLTEPLNPRIIVLPPSLVDYYYYYGYSYGSIQFNPANGWLVFSSHYDGRIEFWDASDPDQIQLVGNIVACEPSPCEQQLHKLSFSTDGKYLAAADISGNVTLWNISNPLDPKRLVSWNAVPILPEDYNYFFDNLILRPDGKALLAVGCQESCEQPGLLVWDLTDPLSPRLASEILNPYSSLINSLAYSPDNKFALSIDSSGLILLWDLTDLSTPKLLGQPLNEEGDWVSQVAFSHSGGLLATTGDDASVMIYAIRPNGAQQFSHIWPSPLKEPFTYLIGSQDGQRLVSYHGYSEKGEIILWQVPDGPFEANDTLQMPSISATIPITTSTLALSPGGDLLAGMNADGQLHLWDLGDYSRPELIFTSSRLPHGPINGLTFSPDQRWLASSSDNGLIFLWDLSDLSSPQLKKVANVDLPNYWPLGGNVFKAGGLVFDANETHLLVASCTSSTQGNCTRSFLVVFDLPDMVQTILPVETQHTGLLEQLAFQPGGTLLAAIGRDGLSFWDFNGARVNQIGELTEGEYSRLAFSADGQYFIVGSYYGSMALYDLEEVSSTNPPQLFDSQLYNHENAINGLVFSGDDYTLISTSNYLLARQKLPLDPKRMTDLACSIVGRNMDETAEWRKYFTDTNYRLICPGLIENP